MTNYPNSLDGYAQIPTWEMEGDEYIVINALRDATLAIEKELGISPKGVYSDARARFDILESRINYSVPPNAFNSDGYIKSPLFLLNVPSSLNLSISDGYGAPTENRIDGSLYLRNDGYVQEGLYSRRGGVWKQITTDPWIAAGDLSGTYLTQTVIGIRGKSLNSSLATVGSTQDGYHLTWDNADGYWRAETGFVAGSDLAADSVRFGRTGQKVIRIQNSAVSSASPIDGYTFVWQTSDNHWEPQARPVMFAGSVISTDGYITRTNLTSNKLLQSPSAATGKVGMVNFSSGTGGVSNDYAAILSGNNNTASGQYSVILGGVNNQANADYSGVLGGISNIITLGANHARVGAGSNNVVTATALFSIILGGSNNIVNSQNNLIGNTISSTIFVGSNSAIIINGNTNKIGQAADSSFSSIINGQTNQIGNTSLSMCALIGNGNNITANGLYATVLNGSNSDASGLYATILNATFSMASGAYSLILNGNTNSITGDYSTVVNGFNNTISGIVSYSTILDGYFNNITSSGSWIGDGYNNRILGLNNTIINGLDGYINSTSANSIILNGINNRLTNSSNSFALGNNNILAANSGFVMGDSNQISAIGSGAWGLSNTVAGSLGYNNIFGQLNTTGSISGYNLISGLNNTIDGYYSLVSGERNVVTTDGYHSFVHGKFAKARVFGQQSQAVSNFNGTTAGEAQYSRVVLMGSATNGAAFEALLPGDGYLTFENGKAYDINIRVLIVNNQNSLIDPTKPARFIYDILASQETDTLTLHETINTLMSQNGTGWTVIISAVSNELRVTIDTAIPPASPIPFNTSDRRAIVTVEWREITRI